MRFINTRLVIIHSLGTLMLMVGLYRLSFLYDLDLIQAFVQQGQTGLKDEEIKRIGPFLIAQQVFSLVGLLLGLVISVILVWRGKHKMVNSGLVLVLSLCLYGMNVNEKLSASPLLQFLSNKASVILLINAIVFASLGVWLYFSKYTNRLISNHG